MGYNLTLHGKGTPLSQRCVSIFPAPPALRSSLVLTSAPSIANIDIMEHRAPSVPHVQPYVYAALPSPTHTRLLHIKPANDTTAALCCHIHCVDLHDPDTPLYDAISYTWGGEVFSQVLWVDDESSQPSQIYITANLSDALRKFRRRDVSRFVWADAVCINQQDDQEKSVHITFMTDIYRVAAKVLVWLGHNELGEEAITRIKPLRRLFEMPSAPISDVNKNEMETRIMDLCALPWFSRRWIIQEVVLNTNVELHCGAEKLLFSHLGLTVLGLTSSSSSNSKEMQAIVRMFRLWTSWSLKQPQKGTLNFLTLMQDFEHFGCADGRDRIYTLAALAEDVQLRTTGPLAHVLAPSESPEFVVDYEQSVDHVFTTVANTLSSKGQLDWILDQAMMRPRRDRAGTLPTWVPDWCVAPVKYPLRSSSGYPIQREMRQGWYNDHVLRGGMRPGPAFEDPKSHTWALGNTGAHLLRANLSHVVNWARGIPDQYKKRWNAYLSLPFEEQVKIHEGERNDDADVMTHFKWTKDIVPPMEEEGITPLFVTWKSQKFPDSKDHSCVLDWIKSTFSSLWDRVLASFAENGRHEAEQDAWATCIDRFAWVIIAGGMFFSEMNATQQRAFFEACEFSETDWSEPRRYKPREHESFGTEYEDIDFYVYESPMCQLFEHKEFKWWKISGILCGILRGTAPASSADPFLDLIAITMEGRCLFTCEVPWQPANALAADVIGIGTNEVNERDKVMSFSNGTQSTIHVTGMWSRTLLVQEVSSYDINGLDEAHRSFIEEQGPSNRQAGRPPVFRFVGDCFLSTTRWASPLRGLQMRRWAQWKTSFDANYLDVWDERSTETDLLDIIIV